MARLRLPKQVTHSIRSIWRGRSTYGEEDGVPNARENAPFFFYRGLGVCTTGLSSIFRLSGWLCWTSSLCWARCTALFNWVGIRHSRIFGALTHDVAILLIGTAVIFSSQGLYRSVIRYMGQQAVWDLVKAVSLSTMTLGAAIFFTKTNLSGTAALVFWLCCSLVWVGSG